MNPIDLWRFLPIGYLASVAIEGAILVVGLSPRHPLRHRIFASFWLTACTYPIVVLVLPMLLDWSRPVYLSVAETFAPVAECALFWFAFGDEREWGRASMWRDFGVIVAANLASFVAGELLFATGWL